LYRMVGYVGPLEGEATAADEASFAAPGLVEHDPAEMPPLDANGLDQPEERLNREPRKTLARVRETWDPKMTQKRLRAAIANARRALAAPDEFVAEFGAKAVSFSSALPPISISPAWTSTKSTSIPMTVCSKTTI